MVAGYFDEGFSAVRDAFAAIFDDPTERGAALCVTVAGETLIDAWAGYADKRGEQPWQQDTLVNVFSCTKPFAAVALLQLVEEGALSLDAPLAQYWPEFGVMGKECISLRQVLCHSCGLAAIHQPLPAAAMYDWQRMVGVLAAEEPWWPPGQAHGYAPLTYGWLLGEPMRRLDGRSPGASVRARVTQPLGLDFHIGLADQDFARVAYVARAKGRSGDAATQRMLEAMWHEPQSVTMRSFNNPPSAMTGSNSPEWRRLEQLAASGHGNARSLAGFYGGLLDGTLLGPEMRAEMRREHARGPDLTLRTSTRLGLGVMLDQPGVDNATYGAGPMAFGHPGAGGSCGFADPERGLAFGFVTNTLGPYLLMDPRVQRLARAVMACL